MSSNPKSPKRGWCSTSGQGKALAWIREHKNYHGADCLIYPFYRGKNSYGRVGVEGTIEYAHRVMCREAHGEPNFPNAHVAHSCHDGCLGCINPQHLRWATKRENDADLRFSKRKPRGERHPLSKLTSEDVEKIRNLPFGQRGALTAAASAFGVSRTVIQRVRDAQSYK